jgi:putative MATE family efflux protein
MFRLKDFNIFDRKNEYNYIHTADGDLSYLKLTFPLIVEQILRNLMNTVSVYILGRFSDNSVASVGVATQIVTAVTMFYTVIGTGTTVVINQNLGAGNREVGRKAAAIGITVCASLAVFLGALASAFAVPILRLMKLEDALLPEAVTYLRIVAGVSIFQAVMTAMMAVSRAYGNTLYPVIVSVLMNVLNAAGSYLVIIRPFETPLYGVSGIAIVRVISEALSCLVMAVLLGRLKIGIRFRGKGIFSVKITKDILSIGIPSGVQSFSYTFSQLVSTSILAVLGAAAISAKIYVQNIVVYSYLLGLALGQGNGLMAARLIGQKNTDLARRMTYRNLINTVVLNGLFAGCIALARYPLLRTFTEDPQIIKLAAVVMVIDVIVELGRGMNHVMQNALHAAGDARYTMMVNVICSWGVSIPFAWLFGVKCGMGLTGCWIAFAMDEVLRGSMNVLRWRSGKWKTKALV